MEEKKHCIFLVDDNIVNLNTGKTVLQHKYTVVTMPSGEKLLQMLSKIMPDLILLDIEMPDMNGFEALKKIKENPGTAEIPVIFLTGKNDPENELEGLSLGAVDYITKPFSPPRLLRRIETHLTMVMQKNELRAYNENLLGMVEDRTRDVSVLQNAIIKWAAELVEFRDHTTGGHVGRVQRYLDILLRNIKKTEIYAEEAESWDSEVFLKSSLLHDVGKIKIRDNILLKETKLTPEEFEAMKLHTVYGKELLDNLQDSLPDRKFLDCAKTFACSHHERWDGSGYPNKLKKTEIPLQARMMALADVYDALISERPYKKAFSHEEAMKIITEGRETQFDPILTDLFISLSDEMREASGK